MDRDWLDHIDELSLVAFEAVTVAANAYHFAPGPYTFDALASAHLVNNRVQDMAAVLSELS